MTRLTQIEKNIFQMRQDAFQDEARYAFGQLYGELDEFEEWFADALEHAFQAYKKRPRDLRALDQKRLNNPDWYQESEMVGYICYTDRFAQTLNGVAEKIDYLNELGVTYLHLMPLLEPRPEPNDGGYAVMNYRQVDSKLGSIDDLADLAQKLRSQGISLCTDLVCNHTAIEHEWARKARAGNPKYQAYYLTYTNRKLPDQYEAHLREIFPENAPGNFIFDEEMGRWVWSTFNTYQWDLNYRNPAVFIEMLDIILNLANHGVEIVRLDAVAFMWKELGTSSENLPEAHAILQAFRAFSRMAAPGLIFKAEAIVAPDDVVPYLGTGKMAGKECEIAYHNSLMVYMWSMLAEQNVVLSTYSLQQLPIMPTEAAWVNYVRLHDDIGWAIMDEYAAEVGLNGFMHRSFLSDFYAGSFPGTHAKGDIFQYNPETGDRRVCGSCASLAGLETALDGADAHAIDLAVKRILLIHSMIFAAGGIPLIYMGDELGMTNDYSYLDDPTRKDDSRWMQRPIMNWKKAAQRHNQRLPEGRIFAGMRHISEVRKSLNALHSNAASEPIWTHNDQIFGLIRESARGRVLVLGNFSDQLQLINAVRMQEIGFAINLIDHLTGKHVAGWQNFVLEPFESLWLEQR